VGGRFFISLGVRSAPSRGRGARQPYSQIAGNTDAPPMVVEARNLALDLRMNRSHSMPHHMGPGFLFQPLHFDPSRRLPEADNALTTWREDTPGRCAPRRPFNRPPSSKGFGAPNRGRPRCVSHLTQGIPTYC
jgi:hypothetical protein